MPALSFRSAVCSGPVRPLQAGRLIVFLISAVSFMPEAAAYAQASAPDASPSRSEPATPPVTPTIPKCRELLEAGRYEESLAMSTAALERRSYGEEWPVLKASAEQVLGRFAAMDQTISEGLTRYSWSIRLRMMAWEDARRRGDRERQAALLNEIDELAVGAPWRYTDADDLVALGKAALALGADPRDVLSGFFEKSRTNYAGRPDGYLASAGLAMEKGDAALAAELFGDAEARFPDNADVQFLAARISGAGSSERTDGLIRRCLELNTQHLPALLMLAGNRIDSEDYAGALSLLEQVLTVSPKNWNALALRAVVHHLQGDTEAQETAHAAAVSAAPGLPEVGYTIGLKLSRRYRFAEAVAALREALRVDPEYTPARTQLAQDLLRLGRDAEGWEIAETAHEADGYDANLFNLLQLKDSLDRFTETTTDHFILRMHRDEAAVYGPRVLSLLEDARALLTEKYGYTPERPVVVEIFDRPDDFAVRTFGIPDVTGFLGVCFGNLITANSPASRRDSQSNWESVLWHEFCHVITLQMTGNRIPRWLSEGISVYEERLRDPRWGQKMNPVFRDRILSGRITPIGELSGAFLNAPSGADIDFAYFQSSMVVEFIVSEFGSETLASVLSELGGGLLINDALQRHCDELGVLDRRFSEFLTAQAASFAPDVRFDTARADGAEAADDAPPAWLQLRGAELDQFCSDNPDHYPARLRRAALLIRNQERTEAGAELRKLIDMYPLDDSPGSARVMLTRLLGDSPETEAERRELLENHLLLNAEDGNAAAQLLALQRKAENWNDALETGRLLFAVNPMNPDLLRDLADTADKAEDKKLAARCLAGLAVLDPGDAPRLNYRIALLLEKSDPESARRRVLMALENAPRYRDAYRLLQRLTTAAEPEVP